MKNQVRKFIAILAIILAITAALVSCESTNMPPETTEAAMTDQSTEIPIETTVEITTEEETTSEYMYKTVKNPIHDMGGDPWVVEHEGEYYYCFIGYNAIWVRKVSSIAELSLYDATLVYLPPEGTMYSLNYWAPELHYINGEWYIYVAADDGNNENHRMYVLRGTSGDPTAPFEMVGQITDPSNKWAIDGTVLQLNGEMYFIWSGWEGNENVAQNLYIAHMSDPCTIDSERVCISVPELYWEKEGQPYVNEGPAVLQHQGKTHLVYSASGSWTDYYCLGMLTLTGDDPMNADSWEKTNQAVFKKRYNVCYGPGHNSFCTAPDGSVWMIYHGNLVSGTGWSGRSVWIAPVTFDADGTPNFGQPEREVQFPYLPE